MAETKLPMPDELRPLVEAATGARVTENPALWTAITTLYEAATRAVEAERWLRDRGITFDAAPTASRSPASERVEYRVVQDERGQWWMWRGDHRDGGIEWTTINETPAALFPGATFPASPSGASSLGDTREMDEIVDRLEAWLGGGGPALLEHEKAIVRRCSEIVGASRGIAARGPETGDDAERRDERLHSRIVSLLEAMRDNEPDDGAADAVTCWMLWKDEAIQLLKIMNQRSGRAEDVTNREETK